MREYHSSRSDLSGGSVYFLCFFEGVRGRLSVQLASVWKMANTLGKPNSFEIPIGTRAKELSTTALRGWMPVSGKALFDLQVQIASGTFEGREDRLLQELHCDVGLYLSLLFNVLLDGRLRPEDSSPESLLSALEKLGIEEMGNLLQLSPVDVSEHSLETMNKHQAKILKFSIVSAGAAVLMAERAGVEPGMAYSLSMLRNLNLVLLAWNFPSAFSRASDAHYLGMGTLGENIQRILNFSLLEFTFASIKRLRLGDRLNALILNPGASSISGSGESSADINNGARKGEFEQAVRFCEIGEVLARLADPENYPSVAAEWELVKKEVKYFLGKHGVALLNQRLESATKCYHSEWPEIFKRDIEVDRDCQISVNQYNIHRFNRATHELDLSEEDKDRFLGVYRCMGYQSVSKQALDVLFRELLPELGFEWGCFYVLDSEKEILIPKRALGEDIWGYKKNISVSSAGEVPRMIFQSLTSKAIMREDRVYTDMLTRSHLAWRFGNASLQGVLYLGSGESLRAVPPKTILAYFIASRQSLADILGIENDNSSVVA